MTRGDQILLEQTVRGDHSSRGNINFVTGPHHMLHDTLKHSSPFNSPDSSLRDETKHRDNNLDDNVAILET